MSRLRWYIRPFLLSVAIASAALLACKQPPKKSDAEAAKDQFETLGPGEEVLVAEGESSQGVYSPKGDRFLFVSWKRKTHSQPQIYEMDLARKTQRRITFQDGSTFFPQYHPREPWIVYSSTTDEIKENPLLLNPFLKNRKQNPEPFHLPFEVYMHSLEGLEITRLSNRSGFDGEAHFSLDGKSLVWTQATGSKLTTLVYNRTAQTLNRLPKLSGSASSWQSSPDGSIRAWIEWNADLSESWIIVQPGKKPAARLPGTETPARRLNLAFTPDSKWLIWAEADSANGGQYDLWIADTETLCARRLTGTTGRSERYPVVSPDLKWLSYTSYRDQRSRILRAPFTPPKASCP